MPDSEISEQRRVEDVSESQSMIELEVATRQQNVSQPVIVHSSLAAISAMSDDITAMDLQKCPSVISQRQAQKSGQRAPSIWVPTPKQTCALVKICRNGKGQKRVLV